MPLGNVTGIGWRADAARRDGVVHARVLAALSASLYVDAAGEVLWIGGREATAHARAIHVAAMPEGCGAGGRVRVSVPGGLAAWPPADRPAVGAAGRRHAADAVRAAAARLPHPIGAALLGDLLVGEGWAALHDLAAALARDDESAAVEAAQRLTRLGHSSGWDLLAGFVAGASG